MTRRRPAWPVIVFACGLILAAIGVLGLQQSRHPTAARTASPPAQIISSDAFPSPSPVPSPTSPVTTRIVVPELGIDLPVLEGDGVNVPLYKAAHYPGTAWAGDGNRTVLYAHAQRGMFGPLLVSGRTGVHIDLTRADGTLKHYVVTEFYPRWPVNDLKWLRPTDHEEVVLVTCTTYNPNDPRVIAVAEPV